jgi:hypothetical protein
VKTEDVNTSVQFFRAGGNAMAICKLGKKCAMKKKTPFFLRIHGRVNVSLSVKIDYEVDQPSSGTVYSSVLSIPWIKEPVTRERLVYGQVTQVLDRLKFPCRSQALDLLGILAFIGIGLLGAFVVIGCLHGWRLLNIGEWLFAYNEKQRFETLKKAPFANEVGDAHIKGEDT